MFDILKHISNQKLKKNKRLLCLKERKLDPSNNKYAQAKTSNKRIES